MHEAICYSDEETIRLLQLDWLRLRVQQQVGCMCNLDLWLHGQAAKTRPFHGRNGSSILPGVIKEKR